MLLGHQHLLPATYPVAGGRARGFLKTTNQQRNPSNVTATWSNVTFQPRYGEARTPTDGWSEGRELAVVQPGARGGGTQLAHPRLAGGRQRQSHSSGEAQGAAASAPDAVAAQWVASLQMGPGAGGKTARASLRGAAPAWGAGGSPVVSPPRAFI